MKKIKAHFSEMWYMYVLFIFIILLTLGFGRLNAYEDQSSDELFSVYTLTDLDREDITRILYTANNGDMMSFSKMEDGNWAYDFDNTVEIKQDGPKYLAELLRNITSEYQVVNPEDMSLYGLTEESPYIQIDTVEQSYRLYIGDYNSTVKRYYACMEGDNTVYGVTISIAEVLDYTLSNYISSSF